MNRRQFLNAATAASAASFVGANAMPAGVMWPIGCFNRPWMKWSYDEALDGMKAAGFTQIGILGDHTGEQFIYPDATPAYLDQLKKRISDRGLKVIAARMINRHDLPLREASALAARQVDNAARLKLKYLMAIGPDPPEQFEHFYQLMAYSAEYAKQASIQLMFKPHGGVAASANEILTCIERVNHPNFRHWYDAGNIIHYTGKDPVTDVQRVAKHVSGFCAKDCAKQGGDVMLQFGEGKVDFAGVFAQLKKAGFKGPVMVECCGGSTPAEVTEKARANRTFLEDVLGKV